MKLLTAGICMFFLAFATLRAARVPLTYDEAASYIRYIDTSVPSAFDTTALSIVNFEVATNHFLNTLFTKACYLVSGGSELAIRLPNLIGYVMFMGFSLLILQRHVRPAIAMAGFLLLNLNPYVLDFFTLSRGYGLSLGFLMGTLFHLVRFMDLLNEGEAALSEASRALAFACGAVMANFALLNVYLSVFAVLVVAFLMRNAGSAGSRMPNPGSTKQWRSRALLSLMAALFAVLVFSQDPGLSNALYEPVAVRITGLDRAQRDRVTVVRTDIRGRESHLPHDRDATEWRLLNRVPFRGLRIELPLDDADRIEHIEVAVGSRLFSFDPRRGGAWTRHDRGTTRVFEADPSLSLPRSRVRRFQSLMNWTGDARYVATLGASTAGALAVLAAVAIALKGIGWVAVRRNLLTDGEWRPLESAALWMAALAGPPLYLLKRNSELYFGGTRGLVVDTFFSTIENSFYGRSYHPAQTRIVFVGILISLAVFCLVLYRNVRRHTLASVVPLVAVLAIMVITSLSLVVQRTMFQTVYLAGRTALFYIPLYVLFATLLSEAIASLGQAGKTFAMISLVTALSLSAYHFTTTANLKYALDWRDDASTRMMMEDLEQTIEADGPRPQVTLGVESRYIPVAVYYAHRIPNSNVAIISLPSPQDPDFKYVQDEAVPAMNVIRRYPLTHSALVRVRPLP